jgi:serine/threonine-protein kinase PpkA
MTVSKTFPQAIPGYHMLRVLGKGGMAEVYLAHQDSVDREVALKLMSRHLLSDPRFAERFLREARIAAKLQHRHVVSIFDVGVSGEQPYIAMEYLSGGPVMPVDDQPLDSDLALRVVFEMALALDYAHSKGYIHRDVKPDNILLRDDGSCVLSDFGIARTVDSATMMTNAGSIVGTPYYMSPEQLRGKEVDGRADLYSLGVVFYQMLTGKVPYTASDSLAIGIMHMTAPMPRLPGMHAHLQPLLDRMLAKEAADRVQTGRELAALVREAQLDESALSQRNIRTEQQSAVPVAALPSTRKIARIEPQFDAAASFNSAPTGEQGFNVTVQRPSAQPARERVEPSIPANVRSSAPAGGGRVEPTLGRPKPAPRAEPAFGQIDPAMDQAAWRKPVPQHAPSRGVWPWIAAVLILLGAAGAYLKREEIGTLIAGQRAGSDAAEIAALLTQAQSAEAAGRWFDDTKFDAISLYERAVQAAPENTDAKAGLARSLSTLLTQAQDLLSSEPTRSAAILERLARQHADDPRVATLLARLGQPRSSIPTPPAGVPEVPIEQQLQLALKLERAREWLGARGALARYSAVLRIDPNNAQAISGVAAGEAAAAELLKGVIASKDAAGIERIQREWESAQPESVTRQVLMRQWRALQSDGDQQRANISELLNQAKIALAAGQFTSPPGQSAADLFKAVLTLDPNNTVAREGLQKIVAALISQAEKAIAASSFDMAERLIRQASERGASANTLRTINAKLEAKIASGRVATPPPVVLDNVENDPRRMQLLIDIDSAIAQNALLDPPGANAFDLLRQVQRLGPGSDIAMRIERLSVALKVQLGQSVESSDFENAANILNSLRSLGPDKALDGLRGQLLESVISDIHAKIGAGALDAAERRLSLLKQIDSRHPEIPELQLELVSARGAG